MSQQFFTDTNGVGNPRQAPPSPNQAMAGVGGMNGVTIMTGFPTAVGHQHDINKLMAMVEDLGRELEANRQATARIVDGVGRVRERAMANNLSNEVIINSVTEEINGM